MKAKRIGVSKNGKPIFEVVVEEEEVENVPCVKCGRTDLPLHYNRECSECFTPKEEKV